MSAFTPSFTINGFESFHFAGQPLERWNLVSSDGVKINIESKRKLTKQDLSAAIITARYDEWIKTGNIGTEINLNL